MQSSGRDEEEAGLCRAHCDSRGRCEDRLLSSSLYSRSLCLPLRMVKAHEALG